MKLIHGGRIYAVQVSERVYRIPVGALDRIGVAEPSVEIGEESAEELSALGEGAPGGSSSTARRSSTEVASAGQGHKEEAPREP
jgi:hypothetical protein